MNPFTLIDAFDTRSQSVATAEERSHQVLIAARSIVQRLKTGQSVRSSDRRAALIEAFNGTDAEGVWDWKQAYDAGEAAQILFIETYGRSITDRAANPHGTLTDRHRLVELASRR